MRIRKHKRGRNETVFTVDMALTVRYGENLKSLTSRLQKAVEKEIILYDRHDCGSIENHRPGCGRRIVKNGVGPFVDKGSTRSV